MYKSLTDQHKAGSLSNEQNILSNDKHETETVSNKQNIFTNDTYDCENENQMYKNIIFIL